MQRWRRQDPVYRPRACRVVRGGGQARLHGRAADGDGARHDDRDHHVLGGGCSHRARVQRARTPASVIAPGESRSPSRSSAWTSSGGVTARAKPRCCSSSDRTSSRRGSSISMTNRSTPELHTSAEWSDALNEISAPAPAQVGRFKHEGRPTPHGRVGCWLRLREATASAGCGERAFRLSRA